MSATLRHDIGLATRDLLEFHRPGIIDKIGGMGASRWPGHRANHRRECVTFGLRLPRDLDATWTLYRAASEAQAVYRNYSAIEGEAFSLAHGRRGCEVLAAKLCRALGVPGYVARGEEGAFVVKIDAVPTERTTWAVYADWLSEQDSGDCAARAAVIRDWLGTRAVHMKYGVPVFPRESGGVMDYRLLAATDYVGETVRTMTPPPPPDAGGGWTAALLRGRSGG